MATRVRLIARTTRGELEGRIPLDAAGLEVDVSQDGPGFTHLATYWQADSDQLCIFSSPSLILATPAPVEMAEFLTWATTVPRWVQSEIDPETTLTPAKPAKEATAANTAMPAMPAESAKQNKDTPRALPQTRGHIKELIEEKLAQRTHQRRSHQHRRGEYRQGELYRETSE